MPTASVDPLKPLKPFVALCAKIFDFTVVVIQVSETGFCIRTGIDNGEQGIAVAMMMSYGSMAA